MAVMPKIMSPFMDGLAHKDDNERLQQLSQYILLNPGTPSDWGSNRNVLPTNFGLAASSMMPYSLDADKVTRLNSRNNNAITYAQLLDALKVSSIALKISIHPIFNTSIDMLPSINQGNQTNYNFVVNTENSGLAVASDLSGYLVVGNHTEHMVNSTDSNGKGAASFIVPNSLTGSALLIVLARADADPNAVSYGIYSFGINASAPEPNETFTRFSPLNYTLNASLTYPNERISAAYELSYDYSANLTLLSNASQSVEYSFPRFLDNSARILVITGFNGTKPFAEWDTYPQIPLDIGVNFDSSTSNVSVASFTYIVTINSALYALQIECREVGQ